VNSAIRETGNLPAALTSFAGRRFEVAEAHGTRSDEAPARASPGLGHMETSADGPNQPYWRRSGPVQLTSNAERSRVSVKARVPKPVIPRTIGSPPHLPDSPLPRKQLDPKGIVDRNAQPQRRNASRPVQPRAHPCRVEWDGERRGRRPGVRLVEIEELRPRSPRRIPVPCATHRPHRPRRHRLTPPRTRERRAGVTTEPPAQAPIHHDQLHDETPRRSRPTGVFTCHERSQAYHQPCGRPHDTRP